MILIKEDIAADVERVELTPPTVTIIRDEAKIIEQHEKTKRLKLWLPYGTLVVICNLVCWLYYYR